MSNVFELLHRAGEGSPGIRLDAAVLSAGSLGTFLRYSWKRRTARRRADARSQRKSRLAALHPSEPGGATMTDPTTMPFAPQCLCRPAPAVRCEETAVYAGTAGAVPSLDVAEAERSRHVPPPLGTFGDPGGRLPPKRAPPGRTLGHDVGPLPQNLGEEGGGRGTGQERAHPGAEP